MQISMAMTSAQRRDVTYFLAGPAVATLAVAELFYLHPWPTLPGAGQSQLLSFGPTFICLAVGVIGATLSTRIGCPSAPALGDWTRWRRIIVWGLGSGLAFGVFNAAVNALTQVHDDAVNRAHGITWYNVALPWSLPHYLHAAITSECLFRFGAVVIPAWIVSRLFLKGRADAAVFWTIAVVAAWIEPLMHAIFNRTLPFAGSSPLEIALSLLNICEELVFALMLQRFGWPAPILMRLGWYLVVRVFAGYLFPHTAGMYPGPH